MVEDQTLSELCERLAREPHSSAAVEELAQIWTRLARRELVVVRPFFAAGRAHLLLGPSRRKTASEHAGLVTLERVLLGANRKALAGELGVASSTLAHRLKIELLQIGLSCAPSQVPPIVVILAHAARGELGSQQLSLHDVVLEGTTHLLVSAEFDVTLIQSLPPAVRDVVRLRVAGRSYANIASERKTSYRTVANQLAEAGVRFGVSSRLDLLHLLLSSA